MVSAVAQLINGAGTDTNINALARAVACLVPIITYYLFDFGAPRKRSKGLLMLLLHYIISLACAWLLIYLAGLLQKNADVAYWDLLISFTIAYAAIAIVIAVANRRAPQGARARGITAKRPADSDQHRCAGRFFALRGAGEGRGCARAGRRRAVQTPPRRSR